MLAVSCDSNHKSYANNIRFLELKCYAYITHNDNPFKLMFDSVCLSIKEMRGNTAKLVFEIELFYSEQK